MTELVAEQPTDEKQVHSKSADQLLELLDTRQATIGILGMGYVGLPLALAFGRAGFQVIGFDTDRSKVEALERGENYIPHIGGDSLKELRDQERLSASDQFDRLDDADVVVICVPTPLNRHREPDLSYVEATTEKIAAKLRPGQLIVLESTTYPGTTEEVLLPALEAGGLVCGEDFFLAFSPEREDPGNAIYSTTSIPKVVGGTDRVSGDLAERLYRCVVPKTVRVSTARAAEATKLTENIFRAVNIALVNELKVLYERMGIDVREVLDAAATKPFGFMRFDPGPGWGGHCIPVDPFYLSWKAREFGGSARFVELAGVINVEMPQYVLKRLQDALNERGKPLRGSKILVLGLAYKKDVGDPRESPAFEILDLLLDRGAEISYHDPHVAVAPRMRSWPSLPEMSSVELDRATIAGSDAVIIVTEHSSVDYDLVAEHADLIVDSRGVYRDPRPNVVKA